MEKSKNSPDEKPSIIRYLDYRSFFQDYLAHQKTVNKRFSNKSFAQKADLSPSYLPEILSGRRKMPIHIAQQFAKAMKLSQIDQEYLLHLVQFCEAKNDCEKGLHFDKLLKLKGRSDYHFLEEDAFQYFSKWYHPVIREAVSLNNFKEDDKWLAERIFPRITSHQAKQALQFLEEEGFLVRDHDGKLQQKDKALFTEQETTSLAIREYYKNMLQFAKDSIDQFPKELRELGALTLGVSKQCRKKIIERIREMRAEISQIAFADQEASECLLQVNLQAFPLEKSNIEDKK